MLPSKRHPQTGRLRQAPKPEQAAPHPGHFELDRGKRPPLAGEEDSCHQSLWLRTPKNRALHRRRLIAKEATEGTERLSRRSGIWGASTRTQTLKPQSPLGQAQKRPPSPRPHLGPKQCRSWATHLFCWGASVLPGGRARGSPDLTSAEQPLPASSPTQTHQRRARRRTLSGPRVQTQHSKT